MDSRVRHLAAIAYVAAVTIYVYSWALFDFDPGSNLVGWIIGIALLALWFLVGLLVGRWWVLPLLLVPVLLSIPLGHDAGDSDHRSYWVLVLIPTVMAAPIVLAGYLIRRAYDFWPRFRHWAAARRGGGLGATPSR